MIAFLCNKCHQPLDMKDEAIVHLEIRTGPRGVESKGQYGSGWGADLCAKCFNELSPYIDEYYYSGGKYVEARKKE